MADLTKKTEVDADAEASSAPRRRISPLQFLQEVRREMSKVTWPSWKETWLTTMMFFFVVDIVLNYGEMLLIGARRLY